MSHAILLAHELVCRPAFLWLRIAWRFAGRFGKTAVYKLNPDNFDRELNEQQTWNSTTQADAVPLIRQALSSVVHKRFNLSDPLAGKIERSQTVMRGSVARMSDELMDLLIDGVFRCDRLPHEADRLQLDDLRLRRVERN